MNKLVTFTSKVNRVKKQLTLKGSKKGICENFGQREVRNLRDECGDIFSPYSPEWTQAMNKVNILDDWASTYNG